MKRSRRQIDAGNEKASKARTMKVDRHLARCCRPRRAMRLESAGARRRPAGYRRPRRRGATLRADRRGRAGHEVGRGLALPRRRALSARQHAQGVRLRGAARQSGRGEASLREARHRSSPPTSSPTRRSPRNGLRRDAMSLADSAPPRSRSATTPRPTLVLAAHRRAARPSPTSSARSATKSAGSTATSPISTKARPAIRATPPRPPPRSPTSTSCCSETR